MNNENLEEIQETQGESTENAQVQELSLKDLHSEILSLKAKLNEKSLADERNSMLIDKLYAQLDEYKNGIIEKLTKPALLEITGLYDYVLKRNLAINADPQKALAEFEYIPEELETILSNLSLIAFEPIVGEDKFALKEHKVIKTCPTFDKEKDKTICQVFSKGFIYEEKVFRPATVAVYKYEQAENPEISEKQEG